MASSAYDGVFIAGCGQTAYEKKTGNPRRA